MLHTIPLQSLLGWLFRLKDPNLVEASETAVPYKAMVIAITKRTLYEERPTLVGVGLMYKPHYMPTVLFSAAHMHLNVWYLAASNEEAEDWLDKPRLLFVNLSEMSNVIPVVVRHPIFLDMVSKEAVGGSGEPMSPLSFWVFRLHTTWTHPPGEEPIHRVAYPHLLGEENMLLIIYESEKFPRDLMQGQKIAVSLWPPPRTIGTSSWTAPSPGYWRNLDSNVRPNRQPKLKKIRWREQQYLQPGYLSLGSLLNSRPKALVGSSQLRWLLIGSGS